jgi:subtilisin family serine protease
VVLAQQAATPEESTTPETTAPPASSSDAQKTPKKKIPGSYIVVLKDDEEPEPVVEEKKQEIGDLKVKHVYKMALKGFAVEIPDEEASKLRDNPEVKYVEQDQEVSITAEKETTKKKKKKTAEQSDSGDSDTTQSEDRQKKSGTSRNGDDVSATSQTLPWGIDKIEADLSSTAAGDGSGDISGVHAYIIDTGVANHRDLNKVGDDVNFAGGKNTDCNGHGTHVAGTVAAKDDGNAVVGAAPGAPLTGVKVLDCQGNGSFSDVIKGIDWVTANATKPAVANMSLGGGKLQAVNDAVINSAASDVFYAVAAGNDGADACNTSPASAGAGTNNGIMTVAATDEEDREASWSNYGGCVDIWAPGVRILSTKRGGGTTTKSGTSMASPHGAGGGGLYLSSHANAKPSAIETALKNAAASTGTSSKDGRSISREDVSGF